MKTVHLIRHAKSSHDDPSLRDQDRPLSARGRRDAPVMGARMHDAGLRFDVLYSSPATRAVETATLLVAAMGGAEHQITVVDELYHADKHELVAFLRQRPANLTSIGLVLHNPTITSLANLLGDLEVENVPTCAICSISIDVGRWADVGDPAGHTFRFDRPKDAL